MRSLFYALLLLAVVAGSVVLLRSLEPRDRPAPRSEPRGTPVVQSLAPTPSAPRQAPRAQVQPHERLATGVELLGLWHVREATAALEEAVAADSTSRPAWVFLVECYSDAQICREDAARGAWQHASLGAAAADSFYLSGVKNLFLHRDYAAAIDDFSHSRRSGGGAAGPDVRYYLALAKYLAGRLDAADADLEDLLTEDDTVGRVVELSIRVLVARGDLGQASRRAHDLARLYAEEPFPYVLLAQIEMLRGALDVAVEFCNNALLLDARYIPAVLTRANLYAVQGEMEAARVTFEKLLLFDDLILRSIGQEGIAFVDFYSGRFGDGVDAMDEAIRDAVMAGSVRRGLSYASHLVAYLCELGQADQAEGVVDRWVTGFGDIPVRLARMRIDILRGELAAAHRSLVDMKASKDWSIWSRVMGMDYAELSALTSIAAGRSDQAAALVESGTAVAAGVAARRAFLQGYAAFESGDAEAARKAFSAARAGVFGVEFPYRGDPVLAVQSLFFIAEAAIAALDKDAARTHYSEFLGCWADADWDLPAVARARDKLSNLSAAPDGGGR
jgi:tetratricopeptide (TPR) repeat protein